MLELLTPPGRVSNLSSDKAKLGRGCIPTRSKRLDQAAHCFASLFIYGPYARTAVLLFSYRRGAGEQRLPSSRRVYYLINRLRMR